MHPIVVGITGASGSALAKRFIETVLEHSLTPLIVCTRSGKRVWHAEIGGSLDEWVESFGGQQFDIDNIGAPIASGSFRTAGMVVIPCSMGTLSSIAHGLSDTLLERAADVMLKEHRTLVLVPRESPLSVIHLQNMLTLAQMGVRILLPVPAFYTMPKSLDDIYQQVAGRVLDTLGVESGLAPQFRYTKEIDKS